MNSRGSKQCALRGAQTAAFTFLAGGALFLGACQPKEKPAPTGHPSSSAASTPATEVNTTPAKASTPKPVVKAPAVTTTAAPVNRKIEVREEKWENGTPKKRDEGYYDADGNFVLHGASTMFYDSGKKKIEVFYKDNVVHGPRTSWREDGRVYTEGQNVDGKADGKWMQYFLDGKPALEMNYDHGKFQGTFIEYHTNGNKRKQSEYVDGKEMNVRVWDETGRELFVVPEDQKKSAGSGGH